MKNFLAFFTPEHIVLIITLGIIPSAELIVRLTPSEKDNSILNAVKGFIDKILPNLTKDGGIHK
mgnify:CR=1 FL=1